MGLDLLGLVLSRPQVGTWNKSDVAAMWAAVPTQKSDDSAAQKPQMIGSVKQLMVDTLSRGMPDLFERVVGAKEWRLSSY